MIAFEVSLDQNDFIATEDVAVTVQIVNNGDAAIRIPDPRKTSSAQPVYTVFGPGMADGFSFSSFSLAHADAASEAPVTEPEPVLITLEPKESWRGTVSLNESVDLSRYGDYRLKASLAWEDVTAECKEVSFRMVPLDPASIHLGLGVRPFGNAEGEGAFLQRGADNVQLYAFTFREVRPGIGEAMVESAVRRQGNGSEASDVAVPWRNTPFFDDMLRWLVWREGRSIMAMSNAIETPSAVELPAEPIRLVQPPMRIGSGPIEVLALTGDGYELVLVRFETAPGDDVGAGTIVWKKTLPARPAAVVAAPAPAAAGGKRHIAFVAENEDGFSIYHASFGEKGSMKDFRSIPVEAGQLCAGISPALFVDAAGDALVGVLATAGDEPVSCILVEASFPAQGQPRTRPGVVNMGYMSERLVGGAISYADSGGVLERREVVVALEGDRVFKLCPSGELEPVSVPGTPTDPILLAPGKKVTYILYTDPSRGLYLEPL